MEERKEARKARNEKIVNCLYQKPDAIFRLICFPWAGGGSTHFAKWGQKFHDLLEVHSIRLAGRETRTEEPFVTDINQAVDEIVCALLPLLQDKLFAFFGHSMGNYLAFMTARQLKEQYNLEPVHFFVSSATPPHSQPQIPDGKTLTEEEVKWSYMDFGGTPNCFLINSQEFQEYFLIFKADVHMLNTYNFDAPLKAVLSCDVTCIFGSEDKIISNLEGWKDITSGSFGMYHRQGGHFYLMEPSHEAFIQNHITKCLELSTISY
ncbi:S-acyl fatty acid synthase thioesterase, medium chain [Echinops telfairi]|uniref:oleoyl-[acyl-carrier-protein] hydrolase n=1 Tax=Echinops telfairi TaxID=9371 RepID=A0ABM0ZT76_ECHTE|nr:S-acyl fatty acid synthase thioesterase, medium chain [Echinops telfairi]